MDNEMNGFDYYLYGKRLKEATRKSIIKQVQAFKQWVEAEQIPDVTEVSYNDVMAYVKYCTTQNNAQKTIAIKLTFLNHYFMWLIKEGEMNENPVSNIKVQGIRRKKLHHLFTTAELELIYQQYEATRSTGARNRVILGLVVYQSLRMEEITQLTLKDLQLKEGKVHVRGSRKTNSRALKLEAQQMVDLLEYLSNGRKELLEQTGKHTDQLFISSGTGEQLFNTMQYLLKQLRNQHTKVMDWKQLRASVISNWVKVHGLRKAQYMAGHKYVSSTEAYKQHDIDGLRGDIDQFHPIQ
ncbi:integrase/recombinase XerD [Sediminibacterium goheungense]|uniref:Integrase/recombinase XerD n=2 Tax=Sediminibacterium goheungense TaxID=1086393 RepID=A0A4R6J3F1_9BACT|nr:integrase/recombinase XerD [Sediminibacterium goheungense]